MFLRKLGIIRQFGSTSSPKHLILLRKNEKYRNELLPVEHSLGPLTSLLDQVGRTVLDLRREKPATMNLFQYYRWSDELQKGLDDMGCGTAYGGTWMSRTILFAELRALNIELQVYFPDQSKFPKEIPQEWLDAQMLSEIAAHFPDQQGYLSKIMAERPDVRSIVDLMKLLQWEKLDPQCVTMCLCLFFYKWLHEGSSVDWNHWLQQASGG